MSPFKKPVGTNPLAPPATSPFKKPARAATPPSPPPVEARPLAPKDPNDPVAIAEDHLAGVDMAAQRAILKQITGR